MSRTHVIVFSYNYDISRSGQDYNYLEDVIEAYRKKNPDLEIKQIEHLWGDRYGARMAVLFEQPNPAQEKEANLETQLKGDEDGTPDTA